MVVSNSYETMWTWIPFTFSSPIIEIIPYEPVPASQLPRCQNLINSNICGGLLRPHVVWFGENLEPHILSRADEIVQKADVCLVVGTSSVVYPAASFAPSLANRGIPVAEINVEVTPATHLLQLVFYQYSFSLTIIMVLDFVM